jgi:hypothetical protein
VRTSAATAALLALCAALCACASSGGDAPDLVAISQTVGAGTAHGARAVGRSLGTAYRGVRQGFQDPAEAAYGPYPKGYASAIRKHMLRFEGVDQRASFELGEPVRSYLNKGLLRGGEIEWQGWIVDVSVHTISAFGQPRTDAFVVRLSGGDVVEVVEAAHAGALRRVPAAAPRRAASSAR